MVPFPPIVLNEVSVYIGHASGHAPLTVHRACTCKAVRGRYEPDRTADGHVSDPRGTTPANIHNDTITHDRARGFRFPRARSARSNARREEDGQQKRRAGLVYDASHLCSMTTSSYGFVVDEKHMQGHTLRQ